MLRTNKTKAKLLAGEPVYGAGINFEAPALVELLGVLGMNFVMIDCEHGPMGEETVEQMVRAAEAFDITPMARVPNGESDTILRFLDRGVQGFMAPHVSTKEEAEAIVQAARYYPDGERGYTGGSRAADYGVGVTRERWVAHANANVLVMGMVEDIRAVENLPQILSVKGLDTIMIGPNDLAQTMGFPPQEKVDATIEKVVRESRAAGKSVGLGAVPPWNVERIRHFRQVGVQLYTVGALLFVQRGVQEYLKAVRGEK
ncbi:MAG: hypothetical protein HYY00_05330 [Chloroflexi bacterium]|nr:hypothetical protein [Chloroflexota bacterium]